MSSVSQGPEDQLPAGAFNRDAALARLGDDQELFDEMLEFFVNDSPGLLEQIRAGLAQGNAKQVERAAHSLKGMASMFDATRAMVAAALVEDLGRAHQLENAEQPLAQLAAEVQSLVQAMEPLRVKHSSESFGGPRD
jgi:two-component system sensor histidine kinase/response regulator